MNDERREGDRRALAAHLAMIVPALLIIALREVDWSPPKTAPDRTLPPIVFVSRAPLAEPGAIPGLGPHHETAAPGGRLMLREPDGKVREILAPRTLWDVSDPAPAPDGTRIAFAGIVHPDSAWRIWIVRRDGTRLRRVTGDARGFELPAPVRRARTPAAARAASSGPLPARFDDLDPCWVGPHLLCFASTRFPQRSQYANAAVTNLYLVRDDGTALRRISSERNGAEEPAFEPSTGTIVYARWWFNRWRASASGTDGITEDPAAALPRDSINAWQLVAIHARARGPKLAAGSFGSRLDAMGNEPALAADGSIFATYALNLGLSPRPGPTGVHRLYRGGRATTPLAGAIVPTRGADPYRNTVGLAAPSACSPAVLPDGRVILSYDPGARGDFGLWIATPDGARLAPLLDLPHALELDAAPVVRRAWARGAWEDEPGVSPAAERAILAGDLHDPALDTFTFECVDVFAGRGAPRAERGLKLRFFATVPRFDRAGGDTAVLLREVEVGARGAIRATGLPAGVPMFEQLARADGTPLLTMHGPAHVPGLNAGTPGAVTRCIGCHTGHSRLPVVARR